MIMFLKTRNVLLFGLILVATTFVLPTATAASSALRRLAAEGEDDVDAEGLFKKKPTKSPTRRPTKSPTRMPTSSPTPRPIGWVFGAAGLSCDAVCMAAGGMCNNPANIAVDTAAKLQHVVEQELARPAGLTYSEGDYDGNPLFDTDQRQVYFFNGANNQFSLCSRTVDMTDFRICCCGTTQDCRTAPP
jgi:hypothetical protein